MQTCYPASKFVRSAAPSFEPVTLQEAKRACGLSQDVSYHDADMARFIQAARENVEKDTATVCATGTYTLKFTDFPYLEDWFELNLQPISSLTSIVYVATDGTSTTWSSSQYTFDNSGVVPLVRLNYSYVWPSVRGDVNGITVTCVAGYSTAASIPAAVKQAVLLDVARQFKLNAGEDVRNYQSAYDALTERIGRSVYA